MPIKEATFWFGITVFGTGLFGVMEGGDRMPYAIALTTIGLLFTIYSVVAHHKPTMPKVPIWIGLLAITWAAVAFDSYDRHHSFGYDPAKAWDDSKPLERVYQHNFTNETVVVDNKNFLPPNTFDNVTLIYNGLGPFEIAEPRWTWHDGKMTSRLASRNKIVTESFQLAMALAQASGCSGAGWINLGPHGELQGSPPPTK